jgi:hypothetical protein
VHRQASFDRLRTRDGLAQDAELAGAKRRVSVIGPTDRSRLNAEKLGPSAVWVAGRVRVFLHSLQRFNRRTDRLRAHLERSPTAVGSDVRTGPPAGAHVSQTIPLLAPIPVPNEDQSPEGPQRCGQAPRRITRASATPWRTSTPSGFTDTRRRRLPVPLLRPDLARRRSPRGFIDACDEPQDRPTTCRHPTPHPAADPRPGADQAPTRDNRMPGHGRSRAARACPPAAPHTPSSPLVTAHDRSRMITRSRVRTVAGRGAAPDADGHPD